MQNPKSELRKYLDRLIHRLLYIKGLNYQLKLLREWETPKRMVAIETGAYFFKLVSFSFNRTILIELCMLLDDREKKGIFDWLSKAKQFAKALEPTKYNSDTDKREIMKTEFYRNIVTNQQKLISSKKNIIDRVKTRRDKVLTHSDAKYFNKPDDLYEKFPLSSVEIDDLIDTMTEILRKQYVYLFESDLDIKVYATSNVDTILLHIRAFKRVWFDKRAKSLYPFMYKLDDYEEKLEEHLKKN